MQNSPDSYEYGPPVLIEGPFEPPPPLAEPPEAAPAGSGIARFSERPWLLNARDAVLGVGFLVILAGSVANIAHYFEDHPSSEAAASAVVAGDDTGGASVATSPTVISEQPLVSGPSPEAAASDPPPPAIAGTYVVVPGDVLYEIAVRHGTTPQALAALNELVDPNRIEVGQVLKLPEPDASS